jgi:hypothetical protein
MLFPADGGRTRDRHHARPARAAKKAATVSKMTPLLHYLFAINARRCKRSDIFNGVPH